MSSWRASRRCFLVLAAILLAATALRVGAAWMARDLPVRGDQLYYLHAAASLARGEGIDYAKPHWAGTHWPPGQAAFLARFADPMRLRELRSVPLGYLEGFDLGRARLVTALVSVLGVALVVWLGGSLFGMRTGLAAGALLALYPNAVGASHLLTSESNFLVLETLALGLGCRAARDLGAPGPAWRHGLAGLAFGASAYFRSIALFLALPFVARPLAGPGARARRVGAAAALVVGVAIAVAPWTLRNYLQYDRFLLLDTSGGETMYLGNNDFPPMSTDRGLYRRAEGGRPRCRLANPVDNFRCEVAGGLAHVASHPGLFARRVVTRAVALANPTSLTLKLAHQGGYGRENLGWIRVACAGSFTLLALLAILGLAGARWTPDRLAVAATVAVALGLPAALQAEARYRLAALPAAMVFAAHGLVEARACLIRLRHPLRAIGAAAGVAWLAAGWILYAEHL